jgi:hypothetical protein
MYAVVIFPYTKSIRVIPVKWVLNFDQKNKSKICFYIKNLDFFFDKNPVQKGFIERRRKIV